MHNYKFGDKVTYIAKGKIERGKVKSISDDEHVFVVYNCNDEWDKFDEYTGQRTEVESLVPGWGNPRCGFCGATDHNSYGAEPSVDCAEYLKIVQELADIFPCKCGGGPPAYVRGDDPHTEDHLQCTNCDSTACDVKAWNNEMKGE